MWAPPEPTSQYGTQPLMNSAAVPKGQPQRRPWRVLVALLVLTTSVGALGMSGAAPAASEHQITVSAAPSRLPADRLHHSVVIGDVFVVAVGPERTVRTEFFLDDEDMGQVPHRIERFAPFDLGGTARDGAASPFDTDGLTDGIHTLTVRYTSDDGTRAVRTARFAVRNGPRIDVAVADDTRREPIDWRPLSGTAIVSVASLPALGHVEVDLWLDDPEMRGAALARAEGGAHSAGQGHAYRLDTTALDDGAHTLTAKVGTGVGNSDVVTSTFYTENWNGMPPAEPAGPTPAPASPAPPLTFPTAETTGVPRGVELRHSGSLTIEEDGAVIDGLAVTGTIKVKADNVVIRRSLIKNDGLYAIRVFPGAHNLLVEDVEIDGRSRGSAIVCCSNYTLRRVDLHNMYEGPRLNGDVTVEDSYIHHLQRCKGCHIDVLQSTAGSRITVRRNNLQAYNPDTRDPVNASYMFGETQGRLRHAVVEGNLMNGGNYTVNGGGGGTTGAQVVFRHNRFGRDFRYGPCANLGPNVTWDATNVWHDTGRSLDCGRPR